MEFIWSLYGVRGYLAAFYLGNYGVVGLVGVFRESLRMSISRQIPMRSGWCVIFEVVSGCDWW
jgi:hypothetical protein